MGWLDASEYFLMEVVVRDRAGDIRSTFDGKGASDDGADGVIPSISKWASAWRMCSVEAQS
jgi:hypothetical protein